MVIAAQGLPDGSQHRAATTPSHALSKSCRRGNSSDPDAPPRSRHRTWFFYCRRMTVMELNAAAPVGHVIAAALRRLDGLMRLYARATADEQQAVEAQIRESFREIEAALLLADLLGLLD